MLQLEIYMIINDSYSMFLGGVGVRAAISLCVSLAVAILALPPVAIAAPKAPKYADPCAASSKELQGAKGSVSRLIFQRAVVGGLAAAGLMMLSRDANKKKVVTAAVTGAAVGAAAGYVESKMRQNADVKALAGSVYQDIAGTNAEAAKALRAFSQARACRIQAATDIKAALERGEIDRETAQARLIAQRAGLEKDVAAAEQFAADYDRAMDGFRAAAGHLAEGKPDDIAYVAQFGGASDEPKTKPPPLVTARSAVKVRGAAAPNGQIVATLASGDSAELISTVNPAWHEVRLSNGAKGFVSSKLVSKPPNPPPPPKINLAKVSDEVRTVGQPLFEGVEKRGALDGEIKLARSNMSNATFDLAA